MDQLAENGRLVIPVGQASSVRDLMLLRKTREGVEQQSLGDVSFVPLVQGKVYP